MRAEDELAYNSESIDDKRRRWNIGSNLVKFIKI